MSTLLILFIIVSVSKVAHGGYPSFLCPASDLNNQTFFPCAADCIYQHGAETGMCGPRSRGDYNCYCGRFTGARVEQSLHCIAPLGKFRQLCVVDCQCNHGAKSGVCDFERKACKCIGHDPYNSMCQFPTVAEFADFTAGIVPPDSKAWGYLQYFVKKPVQCGVTGTPEVANSPSPASAHTKIPASDEDDAGRISPAGSNSEER